MKTVIEEIIMIIFDWNLTDVLDGKATQLLGNMDHRNVII